MAKVKILLVNIFTKAAQQLTTVTLYVDEKNLEMKYGFEFVFSMK